MEEAPPRTYPKRSELLASKSKLEPVLSISASEFLAAALAIILPYAN